MPPLYDEMPHSVPEDYFKIKIISSIPCPIQRKPLKSSRNETYFQRPSDHNKHKRVYTEDS